MGVRISWGSNPSTFGSDRGRFGPRIKQAPYAPRPAAAIPVDPAGPDRYRGGAKPWESHAPVTGAWRTAE